MNTKEKRALKKNFTFWEHRAKKFGSSYRASWDDQLMIKQEIATMRANLPTSGLILDAGCSNGFSTVAIARGAKRQVKAFDVSPASIRLAKKSQKRNSRQPSIDFRVGDILKINQPDNIFNAAYTIRVLINLPSWKLQQRAIKEVWRVLKPGGHYLLSEAFTGSLKKLNDARLLTDLPPLTPPIFNHYLNESALEKFVHPYFSIVAVKKFSSIYYLGSRFLRYLTMGKHTPDSYLNPINKFFAELEESHDSGDFGVQKLYILKKR